MNGGIDGAITSAKSMIEVEGINTYYGDSHVLFDVSMAVREREVVALLGRNGAGKSTTLKTHSRRPASAFRRNPLRRRGDRVAGLATPSLGRGLQLVPEERRIFGGLTVEENLDLAAFSAARALPLERDFRDFSAAASERRGSYGRSLSGGEQQMLAIARALSGGRGSFCSTSRSRGSRSIIVQNLLDVCRDLVAAGQTIVIVEQNVRAALSLASRAYVLNNGHMVFEGTADELRASPEVMNRYLGV